MGLFDFIKDAGEAVAEKAMGSTASDDLTKTAEISPERLNQLRSEQISASIAQLDIDGEQVTVQVNDSVATLTGSAPSQEAPPTATPRDQPRIPERAQQPLQAMGITCYGHRRAMLSSKFFDPGTDSRPNGAFPAFLLFCRPEPFQLREQGDRCRKAQRRA